MYNTPITYFARVELHGAKPGDYQTLREKMENIGFIKQFKSESGQICELPTAEYMNSNSTETTFKIVHNQIVSIARSIEPPQMF
ncbi:MULTISPECIES: hypothetical protein [Enterobacter]|uniref:hypothetical protein n=1 Tax=Enterobacter TaxID=547 RepID=UPI00223672AC|nr:hypothetical protein [Enterobacter mori]MCW4985677.1 hypothetical protein [Enterobacter mori]